MGGRIVEKRSEKGRHAMATKRVGVKKTGEGTITEVEITETTTAADVLNSVGSATNGDFFLSTAVGQPPMGMTEPVFDRIHEGGKLFVTPKADAGA
jgi:hypothetical protein